MNKWTKWSTILATIIALGTVLSWPTGLASDFLTHWQLVGANTKWIALSDFKVLDGIRKQRQLTFDEWNTWCILGQQLGYWKRCPPR
jgi:hypothetical protein